MKKFNIFTLGICLLLCATFLCGCFEKSTKENMIVEGYNIVKVTIEDKRLGKNKTVEIVDSENLNILIDAFKPIKGTKMKTVFKGYPTMSYVYDFPLPIFLLTLKVETGENSYFEYEIYCGEKIPVYGEYGSSQPTSYNYSYKYVAKDDGQSGCYENKTDGKPLEFFLQFFD